MTTTPLNLNDPTSVRAVGLSALKEALGLVGTIKFIRQYEQGIGDYTVEKYQKPDQPLDEIDTELKEFINS